MAEATDIEIADALSKLLPVEASDGKRLYHVCVGERAMTRIQEALRFTGRFAEVQVKDRG